MITSLKRTPAHGGGFFKLRHCKRIEIVVEYRTQLLGTERKRVGKLAKKHFKWFWDRMGRDRLDSTAAHGAFFLII